MKKIKLYLPLLVLSLLFSQSIFAQKISGEGRVITETINMSKITAVGLGISADVYIKAGSSQSIEIKGQKNIIDILKKEPKGKSWNIEFERGYRVKGYEKLEIHITMSDLDALSIGGSGSIICKGTFDNVDDLDLSIGGSGDIRVAANAEMVNCSIGGSGSIEVDGSADELKVSIGGSGDVDAYNLEVNECDISSAGSGDINVNVKNRLKVSLVGSGDVRYKGSPKITKSIVGSGKVRKG